MAGYVSDAVIRRLPGYYRHLKEMEKEGVTQISSQGMGERMKLTASQIRQDINCFGGFGQQGYGYNVSELREHIGPHLGWLTARTRMVIVGAATSAARWRFRIPFGQRFSDGRSVRTRPAENRHNNRHRSGPKHRRHQGLSVSKTVDIAVLAVPTDKAQAGGGFPVRKRGARDLELRARGPEAAFRRDDRQRPPGGRVEILSSA
jgi:hypothetical protein